MAFLLKQDTGYLEDISRLPDFIKQKQIHFTHKQLQENPQHPGLDSHPFKVFKKQRVFRSRINDNFRIAWFYGVGDQSIILWHVGDHDYIDSLENLGAVPDIRVAEIIGLPEEKPELDESKKYTQIDTHVRCGLFTNIPSIYLRIFGVPENMIPEVKAVEEIDEIYTLGLPRQAVHILMTIYTEPDWSADRLFDPCRILYRANADQLEDYCKGKIRQLMLDLSPDQEKIVHTEARGVLLVKGVAGSGKSTVGIYRALHLAKNRDFFSSKPVLFLTYNEMLAQVVNQLFEELTPKDEYDTLKKNIKSLTFRDMAQEILNSKEPSFERKKSDSILNKIIASKLRDDEQNDFLKKEYFVQTEISQVIKGRGITTWENYKEVRRIGRGQPLQEKPRRIIWEIYSNYQNELKKHNYCDEADLYLLAKEKIKSQQDFEPYPEVVVDEAQDLTPTALEFASDLAGGGQSYGLCLLADPSQSIYYQGISWKDGNVQIHSSRVKTLKKNFRNTKQILEAAWALAKADPQQALDEIIEPETASRIGPKPHLYETPAKSQQDLKLMKELILNYLGTNRYRLSDIAILCGRREKTREVSDYLKRVGVPVCHYRDSTFDVFENTIKVITIHSAKGLEFPVVILMTIDEGVLPRRLDHLPNTEDYEAKMRIERQVLYVGMTRAADELCILFTSGNQSRFISQIPANLLNFHGIDEEG